MLGEDIDDALRGAVARKAHNVVDKEAGHLVDKAGKIFGEDVCAIETSPATEVRVTTSTRVETAPVYKAILTFDDGPADLAGPDLLNSLDKILNTLYHHEDTKGFFYLIGKEVKAYPAMVKKVVAAGHSVGNHSWEHARLSTLSKAQMLDSIKKTQDIIAEVTGVVPTRLRPPYGDGIKDRRLMEVASSIGLILTYWDIDTRDWSRVDRKKNVWGLGLRREKFDPPMSRWKSMYSKKGNPLDVLMHVLDVTSNDLDGLMRELERSGWAFTGYQTDSYVTRS